MPNPTVGRDVTINLRNRVAKSENQKSMCLYPKAAPNDIIVSIAVTHMERRIGKDVRLT
jgi:hypothetical protein